MKLTKKKALNIAIELWEWIVDNPGEEKSDWPEWREYGKMQASCPFCEYEVFHGSPDAPNCNCPLDKKYGSCFNSSFGQWDSSGEDAGYTAAVEFLAQLKEL